MFFKKAAILLYTHSPSIDYVNWKISEQIQNFLNIQYNVRTKLKNNKILTNKVYLVRTQHKCGDRLDTF